ncbi:tail fiber domain-containing protein [Muricauda oceani]|uniref:Tail fiber domain-containing protein n=1 Tax=Flagellimonas oceani TaxID=2698672 RepID=A0A6G7J6V8_9FLAO|nr:tail fiber domain-containing protein [Allomuricauda oceani]MBW8242514.1 tail fiber domain-containing protein [Allomuricauda oceani]QII46274.1 tail fiber domain-containing protein [Allomuricauda oceani]
MERNRSTLKSYFETGNYPTESQFADLIDSFLNINEDDVVTGITDNGDGTYTFQLLSGSTETIDVQSLPNEIPISSIVGLQVILDQYLRKDQDDTATGSITISMSSFSGGKSFGVGASGTTSYLSMDSNGWSIFGNVSANDGQDSHLIIKRNGGLEFNDRGTIHQVWHGGNLNLSSHSADILIAKNNAWLTLDSSSSGADGVEQAAGISVGESGYKGGAAVHMTYTGNGRGYIGMGSVSGTTSIPTNAALEFQYQNTYTIFRGQARFQSASAYLLRQGVSNSGYQVGLYSQASSTAYTSPIYTLGTSYLPNDTTLGNMYGIGFANASASFLNSTDLGTNPAGWGLYVAADGNARIFLNASNGRGYFKEMVYASNFILSSDRRLKTNIEDVAPQMIPIRWRKFKMKNDEGKHQRYGVIAQELEEHCPDFVRTDEEGNKSVAYIDLLVAKNAELEARLEKMEEIIKNRR